MTVDAHDGRRWQALSLICLGVVGALTTWFSATAILPDLIRQNGLTPTEAAWFTNAVQVGFVVGALLTSLVNLPDLVRMNRLIAVSALLAALANACLLLDPPPLLAILARFGTGLSLAGVYPPALKLMATWFVKGRGLALGFLIGALTLGSSMPHLFRALMGGADWRTVVLLSSGACLLAAVLFGLAISEGPYPFGKATFNPAQIVKVLGSKPVFLANLGYFGHMWELYAMWAWILAFLNAAAKGLTTVPFGSVSMFSFVIVASGFIGCLIGGLLSDRIGRCFTTAGMMAVSGLCAVAIGFVCTGPAWLLALIAIVWGMAIIGDSAQFSAAVTELSDQRLVGTALAMQMAIGFALTVVAIWLTPLFAGAIGGWQWAFLLLVPGPLIGIVAMLALRRMPEAGRLAHGAR